MSTLFLVALGAWSDGRALYLSHCLNNRCCELMQTLANAGNQGSAVVNVDRRVADLDRIHADYEFGSRAAFMESSGPLGIPRPALSQADKIAGIDKTARLVLRR